MMRRLSDRFLIAAVLGAIVVLAFAMIAGAIIVGHCGLPCAHQ